MTDMKEILKRTKKKTVVTRRKTEDRRVLPPKSFDEIPHVKNGNGDNTFTTPNIKTLAVSNPNHPVARLYSQIGHINTLLTEVQTKIPIKKQLSFTREITDLHKTQAGIIKIWGELAERYEEKDASKDAYVENLKFQSTLIMNMVLTWDCDCCDIRKELKIVIGNLRAHSESIQEITES